MKLYLVKFYSYNLTVTEARIQAAIEKYSGKKKVFLNF